MHYFILICEQKPLFLHAKDKYLNPNVMKKLLFILLLFTSFASANAYDYDYLTFEAGDGQAVSIAVEGMTLSISDCCLVVTDAQGGDYTFAFSNLAKMYFSDDATGIQPLHPASDEEVEVYSAASVYVGKYANATKAKASLHAGVYVLKSKSLTFKISVK